nr:integrase, catalytic region, zinc finger, CCHC-type, peptidase aspartic, catalytic [Tanacetum cinerariifolium]
MLQRQNARFFDLGKTQCFRGKTQDLLEVKTQDLLEDKTQSSEAKRNAVLILAEFDFSKTQQEANLSKDIQCVGSDTRPRMLARTDFASWQQRIRLYCRGKENGVNILNSIDEGPFWMGTLMETLTEGTKGLSFRMFRVDRIEDRETMHGVQENRVALDEEQLLFIRGGQENTIDEDVNEQPVKDLALSMDNVFQADDCDAFDYDVDEAPTA